MRTARFLVVLLLASLGAAPAAAQNLLEEPRRRQGYYVSLGLALALDHTWRDGESAGSLGGQLISLRLGQLVTRRFGLGLRIDAGGAAKGPQKSTLAGLGIEAQWELVTNVAVHTALGLGVASLKDDRDTDPKLHGSDGAGYTLWFSYEWFTDRRRSGGWAASPMAGVRFLPGSTVTALVALVGVDLTFWTGLPRAQLQLPPSEAW